MAFTTVPTVATGDLWSAANHNTYIKDNFSAIFVGTTAGDIDYYTSATTKSRLAAVNGGVLKSSGSAPSWLAMGTSFRVLTANTTTNEPQWSSIVNYRQGGSATDWQNGGSTNQTITDGIMQIGVTSITTDAGGLGTATVTFTLPFATGKRPFLIGSVCNDGIGYWTITFTNITVTTTVINVKRVDAGVSTVLVNWMALGSWT